MKAPDVTLFHTKVVQTLRFSRKLEAVSTADGGTSTPKRLNSCKMRGIRADAWLGSNPTLFPATMGVSLHLRVVASWLSCFTLMPVSVQNDIFCKGPALPIDASGQPTIAQDVDGTDRPFPFVPSIGHLTVPQPANWRHLFIGQKGF